MTQRQLSSRHVVTRGRVCSSARVCARALWQASALEAALDQEEPDAPARSRADVLLNDRTEAVWSEGARASERPRAGRWVEGGHLPVRRWL